jgi:hypothetical protein
MNKHDTSSLLLLLRPTNIPYNEEWANGTGYFNGAVDEKVNEVKTFTDNNSRVGFLIPLPSGETFVLFQRYVKSMELFAVNFPWRKKMFHLFGHGLVLDLHNPILRALRDREKEISNVNDCLDSLADEWMYIGANPYGSNKEEVIELFKNELINVGFTI